MLKLRKILRRVRTLLWTVLTLVTVLAAVLVGIGKLMMPYSNYYQPQLEDWLSKTFDQPVRVENFNGEWKAFGPRISLQGVIFTPQGSQSEIAIQRAALDIKPLNVLLPGRPLYSFRIIGADLVLERTKDGRYLLSGLGVKNRPSAKDNKPVHFNVSLNGEVRLEDSSLRFDDPGHEIHVLLSDVNGRLQLDNQRVGAEIQARVSDSTSKRVLGDLNAMVKFRLDDEQHLASAHWHVSTGELMLAKLVQQLPWHPLMPVSGRLNAEVWGEWKLHSPQKMQGVIDLRDANWLAPSGPLSVAHLNTRFNWQFSQRRNWRIDFSGLRLERAGTDWSSNRLSIARNLSENLGLWVSSDLLELDFPVQLTQMIMASYHTPWPEAMPRRAQGVVKNFDLLLDAGWQLQQTVGALENVHLSDWARGPDISGLHANIGIRKGRGDVSFGGSAIKLIWPRVFRKPVMIGTQGCHAHLVLAAQRNWRMDLEECKVSNEDLSIFGQVRLASGEGKPFVDINLAMERGDIARFDDYWPQNILRKPTLRWLRSSLVSGQVEHARYSMFGDLDDYPFRHHRGHMQASVKVEDADLLYADGWPHARQINAVAEFEDAGMLVTGRIGDSGGNVVERVIARIDDFKKPVLDVDYHTSIDMSEWVGFIKQTPLLDNLAIDPDQFVFTGPVEISGHIHNRLKETTEPLQVSGEGIMRGVQFNDTVAGVQLDDITGVLAYNREGLLGKAFDVNYKEYPATLDIKADWDADEVFRASLEGRLPVDKVIPENLLLSEPLFSHASGSGRWDVSLSVMSVADQTERETWLEINSPLEGVTIDLPAPLDKPAAEVWPLTVRYPVSTASNLLTANMPGHAQLQMELAAKEARPLRAAVQLDENVTELPAEGQFIVNGMAPLLDLDGWIDLTVDRLSQAEGDGGLAMQAANVQAGQVMIFNRLFDNVAMTMNYQDDVITGNFDGENINGKVRYYKNEKGSHSLTGDFERLIMPDPVGGGVTMGSDPAELPEIHFFSKVFSYLGLELGETRIEGYPIENGYHIASVEAQSPRLDFDASGDWLKDAEGVRSDFNINVTSESLGALLDALDISSVMQGGQTVVHFDAWWKGPPAEFALARLNGDMDLSVVQGSILNASPGAGRMLGLLSLSELPRRLAMDFRDVFGSGFNFDEARGSMRFENGTSFTDDLTLSSTAAELAITGNADMVKQTFDYELTVRPGVSKSFPVLGALAGGPVGAAAGLALQALLRKGLGDATEAKYAIHGPWSEPLVVRLDVAPAKDRAGGDTTNTLPAQTGNPNATTEDRDDGRTDNR